MRAFPADVTLEALKPHLADADALIVAFTEINAALLDLPPKVRIVCKHGIGIDNIDLDETRARGIWVTNVLVSKQELLERSDFVTLHMPVTEKTRNFIALGELQRMKPGAFLINAARGGMVNETDLVTALDGKTIAGAASDVLEKEPLNEHPLFGFDNFIATSHIAGYTDGAVNAIGEHCVENIVAALVRKERPQNVVNGL